MATLREELLGKLLLEERVLTKEGLEKVFNEQRKSGIRLEKLLIKLKLAKDEDIARVLKKHYKIDYIDLRDRDIKDEILDFIPEHVVKQYEVVPIEINKKEKKITLAMANPKDVVAIDHVSLITGYSIQPVVSTEAEILEIINEYYETKALEGIIVEDIEIGEDAADEDATTEKLRKLSEEAPIIKLVNSVITKAVQSRASDIHFEPQERSFFIRFRVDGVLETAYMLPKKLQLAITSRIKIMSNLDISEKRHPQDGQVRLKILNRDIDLRVSTLPTRFGEKIVLRVLDKSTFLLGLWQIGLNSDKQNEFDELISKPAGIILITGPTGSGKTTTLYAAVNKIRSSEKNIITLEDPIEYELLAGKPRDVGVSQMQIDAKIDLTFAAGLRSILRQDPDVIMVGEIRDLETAEIAIRSALVGRLVLSTLHTSDAPEAITRLLDMGIEPFLIASSVVGVMAQRLVHVLCEHCKEAYEPPADSLKRLNLHPSKGTKVTFFRAKGCKHCNDTGYAGRTGIFELMKMDDKIGELTLKRVSTTTIRHQAVVAGMKTLWDNGLELVLKGITSVDEILRVLPPGEEGDLFVPVTNKISKS
jgi:type II secretion system protein E